MRIVLDENIPVQLKGALERHSVISVNDPSLGWKNISNGRLLAAIEGRFDLLITADRNIYAQQNLSGRSTSILVLPTNRRSDILSASARIAEIIDAIQPGEYVVLDRDGELTTRNF